MNKLMYLLKLSTFYKNGYCINIKISVWKSGQIFCKAEINKKAL